MSRVTRAAAVASLMLLCALQAAALLLAPPAWQPAEITLQLAPGASLSLARRLLAVPDAADAPLQFGRDAAGAWWMQALTPAQPVRIERNGMQRDTATLPLASGLRLSVGAAQLRVVAASPDAVELDDGLQRWRYDGARLWRNGELQPPCPPAAGQSSPLPWPAAWPRRTAPARLGGNLYCGNRLGLAGVDAGALTLSRTQGAFLLRAAPATPLWPAGAALPASRAPVALAGADAITLGHTRLTLRFGADTLHLRPSRHVTLACAAVLDTPPGLAWQWRQRALWTLPAPLAGAAGAALLFAMLVRGWRAPLRRLAGAAALAITGGAALYMLRAGQPPGPGWTALLGMAATLFLFLMAGRIRLLPACAALLLAAGLLLQLDLGLTATDSAVLLQAQRSVAALATGIGACYVLARWLLRAPVSQRHAEQALLALAAGAGLMLACQVAFGDETGVFGVQPVELAKLALTALSAHCLALAAGRAQRPASLWLRVLAPAALFAALLTVALVQVDDYSPLVLLMLWAGTLALAWLAATARIRSAALLAGGALALAAGVGTLQAERLAQGDFYGDRFAVWADPARHPHTGLQVLRANAAIGAGGLAGADGRLGLASLGQRSPMALRIPAVQDDFAPALLLHRHGVAGALAVWLLQAALLFALVRAACLQWRASMACAGYRDAWAARLRCFALCGGLGLLAGHIALSWSTNLGLLPVMGQPMSFLSAGGSHLLFFLCPLLVLGALTHEETPSCPSTSNMPR